LKISLSPYLERQNSNFNREIPLQNYDKIKIGNVQGCEVFIRDSDLYKEYLLLYRIDNDFYIDASNLKIGASINAIPITGDGNRLSNSDFFFVYNYNFYIYNNTLYTSDSEKIDTYIDSSISKESLTHLKYPIFIRSVRQKYNEIEAPIEVLPPQKKPEKPQNNLLASLMPTAAMLVIMILVKGAFGGSNMSYILYFGATMAIGMITTVSTYVNGVKDYKKNIKIREKKYSSYLNMMENEIVKARNDEELILRKKYASVADAIEFVKNFDGRLFEKAKADDDFLNINIGIGRYKSKRKIKIKPRDFIETEDEMMNYPINIHDKYEYLENVPVILELGKMNAVGVVGERNKLYQFCKNLIVEICVLHYFEELKVFLIMDDDDKTYFDWARWFKNTNITPDGMRGFIFDDESRKRGLEYLYNEISSRETLKKDEIRNLPTIAIICYKSDAVRNHLLFGYVKKAKELGFVFVFMEEHEELLNMGCDERVFLESSYNGGYIQNSNSGENIQSFSFDHISKMDAEKSALKLACVSESKMSLTSTLIKSITMYELLGIMSVKDLDLQKKMG